MSPALWWGQRWDVARVVRRVWKQAVSRAEQRGIWMAEQKVAWWVAWMVGRRVSERAERSAVWRAVVLVGQRAVY